LTACVTQDGGGGVRGWGSWVVLCVRFAGGHYCRPLPKRPSPIAQGPSVPPGVLQVASALLCPAGPRRPGGTQPYRRDARHCWSVARWTLFSSDHHAPLSLEHPSLHAVDHLSGVVGGPPPPHLQTRSPTCKAWASWRMSTDRLSYLCLGHPLPGTPKPRSVRPYPLARLLFEVCSSSFQLVLCRPTVAGPCAYRV
jgi:hypothetical protein